MNNNGVQALVPQLLGPQDKHLEGFGYAATPQAKLCPAKRSFPIKETHSATLRAYRPSQGYFCLEKLGLLESITCSVTLWDERAEIFEQLFTRLSLRVGSTVLLETTGPANAALALLRKSAAWRVRKGHRWAMCIPIVLSPSVIPLEILDQQLRFEYEAIAIEAELCFTVTHCWLYDQVEWPLSIEQPYCLAQHSRHLLRPDQPITLEGRSLGLLLLLAEPVEFDRIELLPVFGPVQSWTYAEAKQAWCSVGALMPFKPWFALVFGKLDWGESLCLDSTRLVMIGLERSVEAELVTLTELQLSMRDANIKIEV